MRRASKNRKYFRKNNSFNKILLLLFFVFTIIVALFALNRKMTVENRAATKTSNKSQSVSTRWDFDQSLTNQNIIIARRTPNFPSGIDLNIITYDNLNKQGIKIIKVSMGSYSIDVSGISKFAIINDPVKRVNLKITNNLRMKWGVTSEKITDFSSNFITKAVPVSFEEKYGFAPTKQYYIKEEAIDNDVDGIKKIGCANNYSLMMKYGPPTSTSRLSPTPFASYNSRKELEEYIKKNVVAYKVFNFKYLIQTQKSVQNSLVYASSLLDRYWDNGKQSYVFPSKNGATYKISDWGFYGFRCNYTSSKGDPYGTCELSNHAFGIAFDLNGDTSPYGQSKASINVPVELVKALEENGFRWGGRYDIFNTSLDPMHFEYLAEVCPN